MPEPRSILLIHPPVAKPSEPPASLAKLQRALCNRHVHCRILDANMEGLQYLLDLPQTPRDTWSRRAVAGIGRNLTALRSESLYAHPDRYRSAVMDINRVLSAAGNPYGALISLSNFRADGLTPVRSSDLFRAAENCDANPFFHFFQKRLDHAFMEMTPDIIGISLNFMSQAVCAFALAGLIKRRLPQAQIVMGGGLITSWMNIPGFANPFNGLVDKLVAGPGEHVLAALCGLDGNASGRFCGFDYTGLPWQAYLSPGRVLPIHTAAGCYWKKCAFCPEKSEDTQYRPFSQEAVVTDITRQIKDTRAVLIHFLDSALSPKFLRYLIAHPPGVPWYGFARITPHLTDPEFVKGLRDSGCLMLKLGVESGDPAVLDALKKGVDIQVVSTALKTIKRAGIAVYAYLLFGTPAEDERSARKTLVFTQRHAEKIDFLNLAIFNLPAYSPETEALETEAFYDGDLSLYRAFRHPKGWHRDRVRRFLDQEFRKPAAIRGILRQDPPFFTSNHAPFLIMHGP